MNLDDYLSQKHVTARSLAEAASVHPVLISQWRAGVRPVPAARCPSIERATNGAVTCEELRPDVDWGYLRGTAKDRGDA